MADLWAVAYAWVDEVHGLKLVIAFDERDLCSGAIFEWIKSGVFRGLSLGYTHVTHDVCGDAQERAGGEHRADAVSPDV